MNEQQLNNKVRHDAVKVKKDVGTLVEDSASRLTKLEENIGQVTGEARENITTWVEDGVSQVGKGLEKFSQDARKTATSAAATAKKGVEQGLSQFNTKVQDVADRVPDGFGKKVTSYPWVAISVGLLVGILLGLILRPASEPRDLY